MKTVDDWLGASLKWRCASLLFSMPTADKQAQLRALVEELPDAIRPQIRSLSGRALDEWEPEFHRVMGPGGCPSSESSYEENVLAGRGPLLAHIAGFYDAFAYRPDEDVRETPDHLGVELGFLSYLALKVAFALHQESPAEREVAEAAYWRFLEEHPGYWIDKWQAQLEQTGSDFYSAAGAWLTGCMKEEEKAIHR